MLSLRDVIGATPRPGTMVTLLPGSGRTRAAAPYSYRVTYRNPHPDEPGCVLLWEVTGGRTAYQIALERDEQRNLRLHCTCADAVFRAEDEGRFCKHIHGLLQFNRPEYPCPQKPNCLGA
jgi:hypothetical protein